MWWHVDEEAPRATQGGPMTPKEAYVIREKILARFRERPMRRVCAWCQRELAPGREPTTHGICEACAKQMILDARTPL
jgi:hypothetical protein